MNSTTTHQQISLDELDELSSNELMDTNLHITEEDDSNQPNHEAIVESEIELEETENNQFQEHFHPFYSDTHHESLHFNLIMSCSNVSTHQVCYHFRSFRVKSIIHLSLFSNMNSVSSLSFTFNVGGIRNRSIDSFPSLSTIESGYRMPISYHSTLLNPLQLMYSNHLEDIFLNLLQFHTKLE